MNRFEADMLKYGGGNMNKNEKATSGGIGFCGALCIAFIVLKLCHVIDWSWVWVLAPLWIPVVLFFVGVGVIIAVILIRELIDKIKYR